MTSTEEVTCATCGKPIPADEGRFWRSGIDGEQFWHSTCLPPWRKPKSA